MPTMEFEEAVARTLAHIDTSPVIHPENKALIHQYHRHLLLSDISAARQQKSMSHLKIIAEQVGEERFQDMDKDQMVELVAWLYTRGTTDSTVNDYKQVIKQFWKWMNDGEDPAVTKWIQRGRLSLRRILPQSLLTPQDVQAMMAVCPSERDRAFIAVLWETGARIGELIDLRVGDIESSTLGKHLIVSGKTGSRRLLLLESSSQLDRWLAVHPNPVLTAPLWCRIDPKQGTSDEPIGYQYIRSRILKKSRRKIGLDKPVNPHHFRHSRATYLANYLTEAQMCEWFGWVRGSRVPGRYVHLSGRDIDRAYVAMLGHDAYERIDWAHLPAPSEDDESVPTAA